MDFGRVRRASISALILFCGSAVAAQEPLPLDTIHSWEAEQLSKPVVRHKALPISSDLKGWHHEGKGGLSYAADGQLQLHVPASTGLRAKGSPDDPDYATYGRASVSYSMNDADLEGYDRITLEAFPSCKGTAIMNLNILLHTDEGAPLGAHLVNLRNNRWNTIVYGISGLPRKHVRRIEIYTDLKGRNQAQCDTLTYIIRNIRLEQVQHPEAETGWEVAEGHIAYSHSGYYTQGAKTALIKLPETQPLTSIPCQLEEAGSSTIVYTGTAKATTTTIGTFGVMDFTPVSQPGNYRLTCGNVSTPLFAISATPFEHAAELLLNFLYCQRCGHAVPGIHGRCHTDVYCRYDGNAVSYSGGWHDAGDLSQQTLQTCETAISLLEAWQKAKATGSHLAARLLKESFWGLRFVLKSRLGNGYHASSIGLLHWTDSEPGTADDIYTVRKQDCSYDNFLYAAYESYAARHLPSGTLRDSLAHAAREDYDYALAIYEREGIGTYPHIMEHTYNTSPSQYHATMSWSATELFLLTGEARYSKTAADAIGFVLDCQEEQGAMPGYFYRDKTRKSIVHYIHQSREALYLQALISLCESQPRHKDYARWKRSIRLYGNYLKRLLPYTAPYGMIPSGVYQKEEYADSVGFYALHIFAPSDSHQRYDAQLQQGARIDATHYVRRFPIWFNIFNGNEALLLSTGKAAALCGHFLHDDALLQIGREQLYWTVGKNPFCQSLIYGEGHRYASLDNFSSGEQMGAIPVGIRSCGDEDKPYWPQTNNACYKEVWVSSASKFLSLLSEY